MVCPRKFWSCHSWVFWLPAKQCFQVGRSMVDEGNESIPWGGVGSGSTPFLKNRGILGRVVMSRANSLSPYEAGLQAGKRTMTCPPSRLSFLKRGISKWKGGFIHNGADRSHACWKASSSSVQYAGKRVLCEDAKASISGQGHPLALKVLHNTSGLSMKSSLGPGFLSIPVATSRVPC